MNARVAVIAVGVLAGCHGQEPPAPQPQAQPQPAPATPADAVVTTPKPSTPMNVTLDWSAKPAASSLRIEYTLTNHGDKPVWAVDDMLEWKQGKLTRSPDAIIVRNGTAPGTASLFRGNMNIPTHDSRMYPSPGMRIVEPGKAVHGTGVVPLPLHAWHNYHPDKIEPLKPPITQLQLEIQVLPDPTGIEDKDWKYETLADGSRVQSPYLRVLNERGEIIQGSSIAAPP